MERTDWNRTGPANKQVVTLRESDQGSGIGVVAWSGLIPGRLGWMDPDCCWPEAGDSPLVVTELLFDHCSDQDFRRRQLDIRLLNAGLRRIITR